MGVEKDEGCFMLKVDPWGRKQTDGKWGSENFLLKVYLKKLCHKISQNADGVNWHKIKGTWILDLKSGTLFPGPSGHLQKVPQDTVLPIGPRPLQARSDVAQRPIFYDSPKLRQNSLQSLLQLTGDSMYTCHTQGTSSRISISAVVVDWASNGSQNSLYLEEISRQALISCVSRSKSELV